VQKGKAQHNLHASHDIGYVSCYLALLLQNQQIMCTKGMCGWVLINTLDWYPWLTLYQTLHRHLCWHLGTQLFDSCVILDQCNTSRSTLGRLLINSTKYWMSIEYQSRCRTRVLIKDIDDTGPQMPLVDTIWISLQETAYLNFKMQLFSFKSVNNE